MGSWGKSNGNREYNEKQDLELDEFETKQRRSFEQGKVLVYLIAGDNLLFDLINFLFLHEFQIVKSVIHVALAAALVYGIA